MTIGLQSLVPHPGRLSEYPLPAERILEQVGVAQTYAIGRPELDEEPAPWRIQAHFTDGEQVLAKLSPRASHKRGQALTLLGVKRRPIRQPWGRGIDKRFEMV